MKKAYVFPGQGAQFVGMGKDLFDSSDVAKDMFRKANEILGFPITDIMFSGTEQDLKQTKVTQPSIFIHSVITKQVMGENFKPDMVAGHSLGEFSALVASGVLSFQDGLVLVFKRAEAMQRACHIEQGTMAAVLGLEDKIIEDICAEIDKVIPANYNCPGQVVISGATQYVEKACNRLKEAGAKRALPLAVSGAFHSPLMTPAREDLAKAIEEVKFNKPICPIYQNVTTTAVTNPEEIKKNLIAQLTSPVKWRQSIENMVKDGATDFIEVGPGSVLQGLIKKIDRTVQVSSAQIV